MKITRCKYGHYYDKAYFRECPHCCRARGGRDEDIIIGKNELSTDLSGKNSLPGRNVRINQLQDESFTYIYIRSSRWSGNSCISS